MPDRILRQGIRKSRATMGNIRTGGWMAGVFYDWLLTIVDDFGRYEADSELLRAELFPYLLDMVETSDVERCLASCEKSGLIRCYECGGKKHLVVLRFDRPRAVKSRYSEPPDGVECWREAGKGPVFCAQMRADVRKCAQVRADVPYSYSVSDSVSDSVSIPPNPPRGGRGKRLRGTPGDKLTQVLAMEVSNDGN